MSKNYLATNLSLHTLDVLTADSKRANDMVDAAVECAGAAFKSGMTVVSIEAPPAAAAFAYSAIVGSAACATKLSLLASGASPEAYAQAASALEVLSPAGLATVLSGAMVGKDFVQYAGYSNIGFDLRDAVADVLAEGYRLGDLAREKELVPFAFVGIKIGLTLSSGTDRGASDRDSRGGAEQNRGGSDESDFVPQGGPGQHAEPF